VSGPEPQGSGLFSWLRRDAVDRGGIGG